MSLLEQLADKEFPELEGMKDTGAGRVIDTDVGLLLSKAVPEGHRNDSYTRLAGVFRAAGLSQGVIEGMLRAVNGYTHTGLPERDIQTIARSVSRYQPKPEKRIPREKDILSTADLKERYYTTKSKWSNIETGIKAIDEKIFAFCPGDVCLIAGRSGTGKTNVGIDIMSRACTDYKGLFCSLEMNAEGLYFRLANISYSRKTQEAKSARETFDMLNGSEEVGYNNLLWVDRDSQNVEQIEEHLINARDRARIPIICIDYLGYISGQGNSYERTSQIARQVKGLAKRQEVIVFLLCQTSRQGEDGTIPVKLHHLRDSGAIEESADWIIGMWKSSDYENRIHLEWLKCRHGIPNTRFDFENRGLVLIEREYAEDGLGI